MTDLEFYCRQPGSRVCTLRCSPVLRLKMAEPPERRSLGPSPEAPALTLYHPAGAVTFFLKKQPDPYPSERGRWHCTQLAYRDKPAKLA